MSETTYPAKSVQVAFGEPFVRAWVRVSGPHPRDGDYHVQRFTRNGRGLEVDIDGRDFPTLAEAHEFIRPMLAAED